MRVSTGFTAPSRTGFKKLMLFHAPSSGGLRFAVPGHRDYNLVRIVERCPDRVRQ